MCICLHASSKASVLASCKSTRWPLPFKTQRSDVTHSVSAFSWTVKKGTAAGWSLLRFFFSACHKCDFVSSRAAKRLPATMRGTLRTATWSTKVETSLKTDVSISLKHWQPKENKYSSFYFPQSLSHRWDSRHFRWGNLWEGGAVFGPHQVICFIKWWKLEHFDVYCF